MRLLRTLIASTMLLSPLMVLGDDFVPINDFKYTLPNGTNIGVDAEGDEQANKFFMSQAVSSSQRQHTTRALDLIHDVQTNYFVPIQVSLKEVAAAQARHDAPAARAAAAAAKKKLWQIRAPYGEGGVIMNRLQLIGIETLQLAPLRDYWSAINAYDAALEESVREAQGIPAQVETHVASHPGASINICQTRCLTTHTDDDRNCIPSLSAADSAGQQCLQKSLSTFNSCLSMCTGAPAH
jgi:hypothetical protein